MRQLVAPIVVALSCLPPAAVRAGVDSNDRIYSLTTEDFAPTTVLLDHRLGGSVQFPFKGLDSVWQKIQNDNISRKGGHRQ